MNALLSEVQILPRASVRQQLTRQMREMILTGKIRPGDRLPSNQQLSGQWGVASSSVQAVMSSLVKEGLLQRARKRGTFVTERKSTLTSVGIYLAEDIWRMRVAAFRRAVVVELSDLLRIRRVTPDVWIDSRPKKEQPEPWPELTRMAEQRQLQAVLMIAGDARHAKWLSRLPVPVVTLSHGSGRNTVSFETDAGERLAAGELARQGCCSAGIIAATALDAHEPNDHLIGQSRSSGLFLETLESLGLKTRTDWIRIPVQGDVDEREAEQFGYDQMKAVLALPDRPDGMYVRHDWVARGALMAITERSVAVPQEMKLVLHRNVELGLFCPLAASFVDYSVKKVAAAMIGMIHAQLRGEEFNAIRIPPTISMAEEPPVKAASIPETDAPTANPAAEGN